MINDIELGWLVGLLEGEGSFVYAKGTQVVQLQMVDEDVIDQYRIIVRKVTGNLPNKGMTCSTNVNRQDTYYAHVTGENARMVMRLVVRHMSKRRRIRIWQALNKFTPKALLPDLILILTKRMAA